MSNNGQSAKPAAQEMDSTLARQTMVEQQIRKRGIRSERVLAAMLRVPRHEFVPADLCRVAYEDGPLPIGENQTISQPYMVAAMTDALELNGTENVLEVGAGSGYQTAVLALLARQVTSIEWYTSLATAARERLQRLALTNALIVTGDGTLGYPQNAPYDGIIVTAAAPAVPQPLVEQLAEGGRLIIPVGTSEQQELVRLRKHSGRTSSETIIYCRFVPLVGRHGWQVPFTHD